MKIKGLLSLSFFSKNHQKSYHSLYSKERTRVRLKTFDKIKFLNIKYFVNLFNLQIKKRRKNV